MMLTRVCSFSCTAASDGVRSVVTGEQQVRDTYSRLDWW